MSELPDLFKKRQAADEDVNLDNLEELLNQLTNDEIDEINDEFDAENDLLPARERVRNQTNKAPTGAFSKQHLLDFLEEQAKNEKDWDSKVFIKETKGKVWQPKKTEEKLDLGDGEDYTEWDDILKQASEAELVDLAAILGFHSFLNQVQYHAAINDEKPSQTEGGFQGVAKAEVLKVLPNEPPNATNVDESLEQIEANDPALTTLNLNNILNIPNEKLVRFAEALKGNTNLKTLLLANTRSGDTIAAAIAEALKDNTTLRVLNLESNYITGEKIVALLSAINVHQSVVELRVSNQKPSALGNKREMEICQQIQENSSIIRLGLSFQFADARYRVQEKLKQNLDKLRRERSRSKKSQEE